MIGEHFSDPSPLGIERLLQLIQILFHQLDHPGQNILCFDNLNIIIIKLLHIYYKWRYINEDFNSLVIGGLGHV